MLKSPVDVDFGKTSVSNKSEKEETAQIQKKGILKNAVTLPVLLLSPVNVASAKIPADAHKNPAAEVQKDAVTDTPASPTPEASAVSDTKFSCSRESPASPIKDTPASPPVLATVKPVKSKKIVDIAEVLRRGKLAAAGKATETATAPANPKTPIKEKADEPASPVKAMKSPPELMSPTINKAPQMPKVIPLIPLSPTHEMSSDDTASGPRAIPLSPTRLEGLTAPSSPAKTEDKNCPSSPTTESRSSVESKPQTIPLSPTSLKVSLDDSSKTLQPNDSDSLIINEVIQPVSSVVTPAVSSSYSAGLLGPTNIPAFLTVSTDDDDSDNEPGLSIAEDLTPIKEKSPIVNPHEFNTQTLAFAQKLEFNSQENIDKTKPINTDRIKLSTKLTAAQEGSADTVSEGNQPLSDQASHSTDKDVSSFTKESRLSPVFGLQSGTPTHSFDAMVARPLASLKSPIHHTSQSGKQPANSVEEQSLKGLSAVKGGETHEDGPSSPKPELFDSEVPVAVPIIPSDNISTLESPLLSEPVSVSEPDTISSTKQTLTLPTDAEGSVNKLILDIPLVSQDMLEPVTNEPSSPTDKQPSSASASVPNIPLHAEVSKLSSVESAANIQRGQAKVGIINRIVT